MEARAGGAVHRLAVEWSGVLEFRNSSVKGTRALPRLGLRPHGLLRQPASDWSYCRRSPCLFPCVPAPTEKKANFMPVRCPGLSEKVDSFSDRNRNHY
jgi:hypothetical protein